MESNNLKNSLGKESLIEKDKIVNESNGLSFKVFIFTIGLSFVWLLWGIAMSGEREIPFVFRIASYIIFWPSQILVEVGFFDEKFSIFGFFSKVLVNAISYSVIIPVVDRIYFKCNNKHIFDK